MSGTDNDGHVFAIVPDTVDLSFLDGAQLSVARGPFNAAYTSPAYDLRTTGKLTPIKNQGSLGVCWAFATMGSVESYLMPGEAWDFSENNLKNRAGFDMDINNGGGNKQMSTAYLTRWDGPVLESDDPYSNSTVSPAGLPVQKHVQEVLFIPGRKNSTDNDNLKWAVQAYGAVQTSMYWAPSYYNSSKYAYYQNTSVSSNHDVDIVGWNDSYSRYNFNPAPPIDGAFIVRNSWGTWWGEDGYFYISYADSRLGQNNAVYISEPTTDYHGIYQYDPLGFTYSVSTNGSKDSKAANVFTSSSNEAITAAGFYTLDTNARYELWVYTNLTSANPDSGQLADHDSGTIAVPGYHTVKLTNKVPVPAGKKFSVILRVQDDNNNNPMAVEYPLNNYCSKAVANKSESYYYNNGWHDLTDWLKNANVCLKAYTDYVTDASIISYNIPSTMTQGAPYTATVTVKNTGTKPWTSADSIRFGALYDSSGTAAKFGSTRFYLPSGTTVNPGSSYTFNFTLTAPTTAGTYYPAWQMVWEGHQWFGQQLVVTVNVVSPVPNAAIVSYCIPGTMAHGQSYACNITVKNTGTTSWSSADAISLGALYDSAGTAAKFGATRFSFPSGVTVNPGQQYTFNINLTAPAAGTYYPAWQMVWDGHQWFGQQLIITVNVT